ncbi:MAG: LL-diaminopimelate aminotransferase [Firmicutes bacterium]|nr:LL-diaminopimelate aminotransferase [Bacillota bacterium]
MAKINSNYRKLNAGYLFPEIGRRINEFQQGNPGVKVHRLGIGNTTEPLTPEIVRGLHKAIDLLADVDTYSGYGDEQGETALREALANFYEKRGVTLNPDQFFISDGAKPDAGNIQSIFSMNNLVAFQDPAYPVYVDSNVIGGRSGHYKPESGDYAGFVYMVCREENNFIPDPPAEKVDIIYICSPNNPTGAVATHAELRAFVDYALENRAVIIFDASYSEFIKDMSLPRSIYEIEGAKKCAIEINSFSKSAGFTGVRLGWSVVPEEIETEDSEPGELHRFWLRRQTTFFNGASNIAQKGGLAVLSEAGQKECADLIAYYMENARIIRESLHSMGLKVYGGVNAPYLWLKTPGKMPSWGFFDKLLSEAHVVGTPGSGFGPSGEGYFRLSAFGHRADIEEAVESIRNNLVL